ncbi:uncharacterized protein LOC122650985 [Telopea speciosissima]|uniref:uncharacterized protein LOC122650985 n=1 Tax=Telopea speciosissima TaxID=54955 RepID=UPI001CC42621|nr:uncharacterized protein LOC122650985 [Telopea speciosissima]
MGEDEWVREAMTDDWMVAELLMRLRQSKEQASLLAKRLVVVLPEWGMRQPRSRQILRCSTVQAKKEGESTRASPTTPLSWSGGMSLSGSGTVDCYEESSCPVKRKSVVRSKVISTGENSGRRSRKKKTYAELKEEESELLKERIHLKKELATLRTDFGEQRAWNVKLKKMKVKSIFLSLHSLLTVKLFGAKPTELSEQDSIMCKLPVQLDFQLQPAKEEATNVDLKEGDCDVLNQEEAYSVDHFPSVLPKQDVSDERDAVAFPSSVPDSCRIQKEDGDKADNLFVLPDLNLPLDEDSNSEVLYGIS